MAWLEEGNDVRFGEWGLREVEVLNTWCVCVFARFWGGWRLGAPWDV
jgi:hypothetical protein